LRPFAGAFTKGFWNTIRRARYQVFYLVPPFIAAYSAMQWAIERYVACATGTRHGNRDSELICVAGTSTSTQRPDALSSPTPRSKCRIDIKDCEGKVRDSGK
jgi:hypothetical protein